MTNIKKLRIMIIDDDPAINLLLKTSLSRLGHHVLVFSDPTACQALQKTTCSCPQEFPCADVIISDIVMPNMSGIDFFKRIKATGCKTLDANKALISATTDSEHFDEVEELGCKFFGKPFKLAELVTWINACAERIPEDRVLAQIG